VRLVLQPTTYYLAGTQPATPFPLEVKAKNIVVGALNSPTDPVPVGGLVLDARATTLNENQTPAPGQSQRSDVIIEAEERFEAYLTGDMELMAGTARATTTGSGQTLRNTAIAAIRGKDMIIRGLKASDLPGLPALNASNITITGGNAASDASAGGGAIASADAFLLADNSKLIDIGGNLALQGGITALTGQSTAVARVDPNVLRIITGGDIHLIGGVGPNSSASIINAGDIEFYIGGGGRKTLTYQVSASATAATPVVQRSHEVPGGLVIVGGRGSGLFGAQNQAIIFGDEIKVFYSGGGTFTTVIDGPMSAAFVQANSPRANESLLRYIIYAANEETRASRARAGIGGADDSNLPSCN
jgi:hypothetical protein